MRLKYSIHYLFLPSYYSAAICKKDIPVGVDIPNYSAGGRTRHVMLKFCH